MRELKKAEMLNNLTKVKEDLSQLSRETLTKDAYEKFMVIKQAKWAKAFSANKGEIDIVEEVAVIYASKVNPNSDLTKEDLEYELSLRPRKLIISGNSKFKFAWDILIIALAIYIISV